MRLTRIHLEEDAGKAIHDRGERTLVDLNRAGVPLIESVTEADLRSSQEAHDYLVALKEILQYAGASDCDMEKGSLRCDVNVSVHKQGEPWGAKVEIKNLNSFKNVEASIEHEIARQIAAYESGDPGMHPRQETRLFDVAAGVTRVMRTKEDAGDYRYFPDPDLPPVLLTESFVDQQRGNLPELPAARRARYERELGLSAYDAGVLVADRGVADFFEATLRSSEHPDAPGSAKAVANLITNELMRAFGDADVPVGSAEELPFRPIDLAALIRLVDDGTLSSKGARAVLDKMLREGGEPERWVAELGLEQVQDTGAIEAWCREALAEKPQVAEAVRAGNEKALGACVGPVMQKSGGRADPGLVRETLLRIIGEGA